MGTPSFDAKIKTYWNVTYNNTVGAENRGTLTLDPAVAVTTIPVTLGGNVCSTLQEILDYAESSSNNITIDLDYTFKHNTLKIPEDVILQAGNTRNVKIMLYDYEKLRYAYNDVIVQGKWCSTVRNFSQLRFVVDGTNNIGVIDYNNGKIVMSTITRSIASGETYLALSYIWNNTDEYGLISNAANVLDLIYGNTLIQTMTNVNSTENKLQCLLMEDGNTYWYMKHYNEYTGKVIRRLHWDTSVYTQEDISVSFYADDIYSLKDWGIIQSGLNCNYLYTDTEKNSFVQAFAINTNNQTYLYSGITFAASEVLIRMDGILNSLIYVEDFDGYPRLNFIGGNKIVKYDGVSFVTEMAIDTGSDDNISSMFVTHRDTLNNIIKIYFIINHNNRTELWERKNTNWEFVKLFTENVIPLMQTENASIQDILFMDKSSRTLYASSGQGGSVKMLDDTKLTGLVIENQNNIMKKYDTDAIYGYIISSLHTSYGSGDINPLILSYCTLLDAIGLAGVYNVWNINNSIINSQNNCIVITSKSQVSGNCRNNILQSAIGWGLYITESFSFNSGYFLNNTIVSMNGITYNSYLLPYIKNCIINATDIALYTIFAGLYIYITYSIINGRIMDTSYSVHSTCGLNLNPLFIDIVNNFKLQHIGLDYPRTSPAAQTGDNTGVPIDMGAYDGVYTIIGEVDKESFEIDGFEVDITPEWKYPKKEEYTDYRSNLIKYLGARRRTLKLNKNVGTIPFRTIARLEKLFTEVQPLRFFPCGADGLSLFAMDVSIPSEDEIESLVKETFFEYCINEVTLDYTFNTDVFYRDIEYFHIATVPTISIIGDTTAGSKTITNVSSTVSLKMGMFINSTNLNRDTKIRRIVDSTTIEVSDAPLTNAVGITLTCKSYYFLDGFLRGFYVTANDGVNDYSFRIDENTEDTLYLKNAERITLLPSPPYSYSSRAMYIYVTFEDTPKVLIGLWNNRNQTGDLEDLILDELEDKYELQIPYYEEDGTL